MSYRLAYSLVKLRDQVNAAYPNRSKASDGWIGDAAHRSRPSDHNPNAAGVVCALDLTHDPAHFDAHQLADLLRVHRHPNLKYLISNNRICGDWTGWQWKAYTGSNPHTRHIHVSVGVGGDGQSRQPYDDTTNWQLTKGVINMDHEAGNELYRTGLHREPESAGVGAQWNGLHPATALKVLRDSGEWKHLNHVVKSAYPELVNKVNQMQSVINDLSTRPTKEDYARAQAQIGDLAAEIQRTAQELEAEKQKVKIEYSHDEETKQNVTKILGLVSAIYNYFFQRYQTFRDSLTKKG